MIIISTKKFILLLLIIVTLGYIGFGITCLVISIVDDNKEYGYKYDGTVYEDSNNYLDNYGYKYLANKNKKQADLYKELYYSAVDFNHKKVDLEIDKKDYAIFKKSTTSKSGLNSDELLQTYEIFEYDNPSFYWLSNLYYTKVYVYMTIDDDYIKYSDRERYGNLINSKCNDIDKLMDEDDSDFKKTTILYDYIINTMTYSYDDYGEPNDVVWAHNIIGYFDKNEGVCETYAKTFKLLCDRYGLENIPLWSENHIWNTVEIDDNWYIFDLTHNHFGLTEKMYLDYSTQSYTNLIYDMPTFSDHMISRDSIILYENGLKVVESNSMDDIIERIKTGNYEVRFKRHKSMQTYYYFYDFNFDYSSLKFVGNDTTGIYVSFPKEVTLKKDLDLNDVSLCSTYGKLIIDNSTLNIRSRIMSVVCPIGNNNGSIIVYANVYYCIFYYDLDITNINNEATTLYFSDKTHIVNYMGDKNINFKNEEYEEKNKIDSLIIDNVNINNQALMVVIEKENQLGDEPKCSIEIGIKYPKDLIELRYSGDYKVVYREVE